MEANLRNIVTAGIVLMLPMAGEVLAWGGDGGEPEPIPATLPSCDDAPIAGVKIQCPRHLTIQRIVQVFDPEQPAGTDFRFSCVCNVTFDRCNPDVPARGGYEGPYGSGGELEPCEPGQVQMVPSDVELIGNNSTYCETIGGSRVCYNSR